MVAGPTAAFQSQRSFFDQVRSCKYGTANNIIGPKRRNSRMCVFCRHVGDTTYSVEKENRREGEGNVQDVLDQRCKKRVSRAGGLHHIA